MSRRSGRRSAGGAGRLRLLRVLLAAAALLPPAAAAAEPGGPPRRVSLDLPGAPVALVPTDFDRDGRVDLAVVVAYTAWREIVTEEGTRLDDVTGLVEVMTVVPALLDRRELHVFRATDDGYRLVAPPLPLPLSVLSVFAGPEAAPLLALTDEGVAEVVTGGAGLRLEPRVPARPVWAGSGSFLPDLPLLADATGDGAADLLVPGVTGIAVHPGGLPDGPTGFAERPTAVVSPAGDRYRTDEWRLSRVYPLPAVGDLTGDGRPDLLFFDPADGGRRVTLAAGRGGGRFAPPVTAELAPPRGPLEPRLVFVGDLDGDGRGEAALYRELDAEEESLRRYLAQVREPRGELLLYRLSPTLERRGGPYRRLALRGHLLSSFETPVVVPPSLADLDGDGRLDLVTLLLDVGMLKTLGSVLTRDLAFGIELALWCQSADGGFRRVAGSGLGGRLRFDLEDLELRELPLVPGDFDGDGRRDFLKLGRDGGVEEFRGRPGCVFPARPDRTFALREPPRDAGLVRVRDLDGDGRSDLSVVQPGSAREAGTTAPVRLDLYLSRGPGTER